MAAEYGVMSMEVSAKTGHNVERVSLIFHLILHVMESCDKKGNSEKIWRGINFWWFDKSQNS